MAETNKVKSSCRVRSIEDAVTVDFTRAAKALRNLSNKQRRFRLSAIARAEPGTSGR